MSDRPDSLSPLLQLIEAAKKATPGPWHTDVNCISRSFGRDSQELTAKAGYVGVMYLDGQWPGNAEFIALARNAIPALESLLSQRLRVAEWIKKYAKHARSCPQSMHYQHEIESGETPDCTCGLYAIRQALQEEATK